MDRDNMGALGVGILIGLAIGATVGILFAPQSGRETREMIREKAIDLVESAKEKTTAARRALGTKIAGEEE
jgi:gas vesicle protein